MAQGAAIVAAVDHLVATLAGAGLRVTTESSTVAPPGVWVQARTVEVETLDESSRLRVYVYLIASESGGRTALVALGELLDKALTVIDPDEPTELNHSVALPDSAPLPAYRLVVDLFIEP